MAWSRLAALALLCLAACATWTSPAVEPGVLLARDTLPHARIVIFNQSAVMADFVSLRSDSVVGVTRAQAEGSGYMPFAVPLDQVQRIQLHHYSILRTLGVVLLGSAVAAATPYLLGN